MKKVMQALSEVQQKLNAPKNQRNNFGKYNYRKAEDIIAAFKSLGTEGETLTMSDEVSVVGGQIFLTATATFTADGEQVSVKGCAMHALSKKGMDEAQITGAASSYARKYALCGLFAIDDSEHDPDGKDNRQQEPQEKQPTPDERCTRMGNALKGSQSLEALHKLWGGANFAGAYKELPKHLQERLDATYEGMQEDLK